MPHTSVPIVASGSFLNQTNPTPIFTIFAPPTDGAFRVTSTINVTAGPGPLGNQVIWTDHQGSHTSPSATPEGTEAVVFALAGTSIQLTMNGPAGVTYDVHWLVEQLA